MVAVLHVQAPEDDPMWWQTHAACHHITPAEAEALLAEYVAQPGRADLLADYRRQQKVEQSLPGLSLAMTEEQLTAWRGEFFFPAEVSNPNRTRRKGLRFAGPKAVCESCPVQGECLSWAMRTNEQFGIWGGLDQHERRELRIRNRRAIAS